MEEKAKVLMIVTLDTKETEARFLRKCLEDNGVEVYHLDASIRRTDVGESDIGPDQIAAAAGTTMPQIRALNHEGKCLAIMIEGAIRCAHDLDRRIGLDGIIGVGGSLGTALGTAVMRSFPFGLPKVMISTMASGLTRPFVGTKDIVMVHSVCDVAGLNTITRRVFENGARAVAGMARGYEPVRGSGRPLVAISNLGATEKCSIAIRKSLESMGFEVMVFHTQGTGGIAMDEAVREQDVSVVVHLSLIEVSDFLFEGLYSGGPDRCKASLEKGVPTIFVPGNIDFIVAGPVEDALARYPGKRYHVHNEALTAVRAGEAEFKRVAEHLAGLVKDVKGPVAFYVPLGGFSDHDSPQGHLYDPSLPPVFAEHLAKVMPRNVPVTAVPYHINDAAFARQVFEQVIACQKQRVSNRQARA